MGLITFWINTNKCVKAWCFLVLGSFNSASSVRLMSTSSECHLHFLFLGILPSAGSLYLVYLFLFSVPDLSFFGFLFDLIIPLLALFRLVTFCNHPCLCFSLVFQTPLLPLMGTCLPASIPGHVSSKKKEHFDIHKYPNTTTIVDWAHRIISNY